MATFIVILLIPFLLICFGDCMPLRYRQESNFQKPYGDSQSVSPKNSINLKGGDDLTLPKDSEVLDVSTIETTNQVVQYLTSAATNYKLYQTDIDIQVWLSDKIIFSRPRDEFGYQYVHFDDPAHNPGSGHILFLQKMPGFSVAGHKKDGSLDMHLYQVFHMDLSDNFRDPVNDGPTLNPVNIGYTEEDDYGTLDPSDFLFATLPNPTSVRDGEELLHSTENYPMLGNMESTPDPGRTTESFSNRNTEAYERSKDTGCQFVVTPATYPTSATKLTESVVENPNIMDYETNQQNQSDQISLIEEGTVESLITTTESPLTDDENLDGDVKVTANDGDITTPSDVQNIGEASGSNNEENENIFKDVSNGEKYDDDGQTSLAATDSTTFPTESTASAMETTTLQSEACKCPVCPTTTQRAKRWDELEINPSGLADNYTIYYFPPDYTAPPLEPGDELDFFDEYIRDHSD
ncbi:unnamed protein product [Orchesella dallaii]|uniref:Uncharacterized protein n=1 Tax=Orchesella dallaii TaxID=48710 RepID=A0ABP1R669_9HEXA